MHGSLLPAYRGAAPIKWSLINGDKQTGLSTFFVEPQVDTGAIINQKKINIVENENYGSMCSVADDYTSSFSAENTAFFQNGIVIHIQDNTVLDKPIQLLHAVKGRADSRIYPRVFVNVGKNSEAEILQTENGGDDHNHFVNSVTEVIVNENAELNMLPF